MMKDVFELEEESDSEFEDDMGDMGDMGDVSDLALEDMTGEDGLVWTIDGEIPFDDGDYPTTEAFLESLPRHMKRRLSEEQEEVNAEEERLEANSQRKVAGPAKDAPKAADHLGNGSQCAPVLSAGRSDASDDGESARGRVQHDWVDVRVNVRPAKPDQMA
jgi:hypothetical protein